MTREEEIQGILKDAFCVDKTIPLPNEKEDFLSIPDSMSGATSNWLINEKFKQGWVKKDGCSYDPINKIFTYYFERKDGQ